MLANTSKTRHENGIILFLVIMLFGSPTWAVGDHVIWFYFSITICLSLICVIKLSCCYHKTRNWSVEVDQIGGRYINLIKTCKISSCDAKGKLERHVTPTMLIWIDIHVHINKQLGLYHLSLIYLKTFCCTLHCHK